MHQVAGWTHRVAGCVHRVAGRRPQRLSAPTPTPDPDPSPYARTATHPQEAVEEEVAQVAAAPAAARLHGTRTPAERPLWHMAAASTAYKRRCSAPPRRAPPSALALGLGARPAPWYECVCVRACACMHACMRFAQGLNAVACRATSTAGSAFANDGQPVPESNFCRESKSGASQPAQR